MSHRIRLLQSESLEDRLALSANPVAVTDQLVSVQSVGSGAVAVNMELSDFTSSASNGWNSAPQATGVAEFQINGGSAYSVALPTAFTDLETESVDLVFSVVDNTNPTIFGKLSIESDGTLSMDLVSGVSGSSELTIQAEDGSGGVASMRLGIGIAFPTIRGIPIITNFTGHRDPEDDTWSFSGEVSGANGNSEITIEFDGDVSGSTTANADGSFSFTGAVDPNDENPTGHVTAQAHTSAGNSSAIVIFYLDDE